MNRDGGLDRRSGARRAIGQFLLGAACASMLSATARADIPPLPKPQIKRTLRCDILREVNSVYSAFLTTELARVLDRQRGPAGRRAAIKNYVAARKLTPLASLAYRMAQQSRPRRGKKYLVSGLSDTDVREALATLNSGIADLHQSIEDVVQGQDSKAIARAVSLQDTAYRECIIRTEVEEGVSK